MTDKELESLGVSIARQLKWDGDMIMSAFMAALTDANCHTIRQRIEDTYNHYLEEVV